MFRDKVRPLAIVVGFVGYVVFGVTAFVVVMQTWWPPGLSKTEIARLAETDPTLSLAQNIISTVLAIVAGYAACQLSGSSGLKNSILVGILLMFYAALNIHVHANDAYLSHMMQFVGALALPTLGGAIRWRLVSRRIENSAGHA